MKKQVNLTTYLAQQVIAAAFTGCNTIVPGTIRESRQLCGSTFWNGLAKPEQILAGQIISAAINAGRLPLFKLEKSPSNHQRYQRL